MVYNMKRMSDITKRVIYIYQGLGASESNNKVLMSQITRYINPDVHQAQFISPQDTIKGKWCEDAALYIIGGGYDLGLIESLGQEGTEQIQRFVSNGGCYMGICSGAYFASSYIEFDKEGPLEVCGERELKFYPGGSIGPVYGPYRYNSEYGGRAVPLVCHFPQPVNSKKENSVRSKNGFTPVQHTFYAYFNEGGLFHPYQRGYAISKKNFDNYLTENNLSSSDETYSIEQVIKKSYSEFSSKDSTDTEYAADSNNLKDVESLCSYVEISGNPAAIVKCKVGSGLAVLSSVHLEYDSTCLDTDDPYLKPVIEKLARCDMQQTFCLQYLLTCLGINVKK